MWLFTYVFFFRYARQACLIGRSNLSGEQVDKLLEESAGDSNIKDTLRNTDVILSLNKKQRWRLPTTVCHFIKEGHFSNNNATVSVLERHKLKKQANCVGFACSKMAGGKGLGFQSKQTNEFKPTQNRHFSYNLEHVDQVESHRQAKKRISEESKLDKKRLVAKTVNVFTIEGRKENSLINRGPVYNLEVFYPCPQSCSLTFNPKYTDVTMTRNDEGEMEIRSNIRSRKKSKRRHRERFTKAHFAGFNTEMANWGDDEDKMWQDAYEDTEETVIGKPKNDMGEQQKQMYELASSSGNLLAHLVDEAEITRTQRNNIHARSRQRRRSVRIGENFASSKRISSQWNNTNTKPHVFYTEKDTHTNSLQEQPRSTKLQPPMKEDPVLSSFPVILSTAEVAPEKLRERFRNVYGEADCQPRRFCINITDEVRNIMWTPRSLRSLMHETYIIFTSAGVYDDGLETYRVTVNCGGCPKSEQISYSLPYGQTTLESIINTVVGNLLDQKEAGHLTFSDEIHFSDLRAFSPVHEMITDKLKIQVDTFCTSEELNRAGETGNLQEKKVGTEVVSQNEGNNANFCEICYDIVNTSQKDAAAATQLNVCGHLFCDTCWQTHLRTRFRQGALHMTCPGYQCNTKLGLSTLLSLLHVTEVARILQRTCEDEMEICPTAKWCPSPSCGRVIKLTTKMSDEASGEELSSAHDMCVDVTCACGERWCFACLSPGHWPARCDQAQVYMDKMRTLKSRLGTLNDNDEHEGDEAATMPSALARCQNSEPLELEGRLCPKCRRFIDKNGGCPHMMCKCGHQFCWKCLRPYHDFDQHTCVPNPHTVAAFTRIVKVRHVARPIFDDEDRKRASQLLKVGNSRQKVSMYNRAMEQRTQPDREKGMYTASSGLITKICRATREDLQFKEEVSKKKALAITFIHNINF